MTNTHTLHNDHWVNIRAGEKSQETRRHRTFPRLFIMDHPMAHCSSISGLSSTCFSFYLCLCEPSGEGNGTPLQYSCLENPMDGGAWCVLQSMGSLRVGHDTVTSLSLFTFMHWRRKWQPTPVFLPGESQGRGSLVGCCLWGCTESATTEAT